MTSNYAVPWSDGLTTEQENAARASGKAERLLAGPGTGKTLVLTRRVLYLVQEQNALPEKILALTFTRAATFELRKRVRAGLGEGVGLPQIQTLHSFALRQLLKNWDKVREFAEPLRIADKWETRRVVLEDLKGLVGDKVKDIERKFSDLAADWETPRADGADWEKNFPHPAFLAAWREHRTIFGYVLPDELVYRLKHALHELGDTFSLERPSDHLLIDEYQDLNRCDLAVIRSISALGALPFAAGDDDQSIYGFRHAHPLGIRSFPNEFAPVEEKGLTLCKRCDPAILRLGLFVAYQDYEREEKAIKAEDGRDEGTVHILRFENQYDEATGVASIAAHILRSEKYEPDELLVLIRSDRYGAYSRVLQQAITAEGIECVTGTGDTPLDESLGRRFIALLRLADNPRDHLAIRSLLQLTPGIGAGSLKRLYQVARADNSTFFDAVQRVIANPQLLGSGGPRLAKTAQQYQAHASTLGLSLTLLQVTPSKDRLRDELGQLAIALASPGEDTAELVAFIDLVIDEGEAQTLPEFFAAIHTLGDDADQQVIKGKINILTMHKAKGLAAKAVFVVGCEDEQLPGRNENEPELGDERRLLYVSLTRAEHYLFVTYCLNRLDQQSHYGRPSSSASRRLTRFLREGPVAPSSGSDYTESFSEAALVR